MHQTIKFHEISLNNKNFAISCWNSTFQIGQSFQMNHFFVLIIFAIILREIDGTNAAEKEVFIGLQALTAFFIIVAAVALAILLRPYIHTNMAAARQYQPL